MIEGREAFHEEMEELERDAARLMRQSRYGCALLFGAFAVLAFVLVIYGTRA